MKTIFWLFLLALLFTSCSKEKSSRFYISGYIYNNCYDKLPLRNGSIQLFRTNGGSNQGGEIVATGKTDSTGYFRIEYPSSTKYNTMKLQTINGNDLMTDIPSTTNCENVNVYAITYSNVKVILNVINPHNVGDTLVIEKLGSNQSLKILCPLSSGPIYTSTNYTPVNPMGYEGIEDYISYGFRPTTGFAYFSYFKINRYCQDTVYVTVDIK